MITHPDLVAASTRLFERLQASGRRIVFAESCTGGLVSAALAVHPGVTEHLCGSAVAYRIGTKTEWLGVESAALEVPGPVSEVVARQMATGVLALTPEADVAVSVTGHLGPGAPPELDGVFYTAAVYRAESGSPVVRHALQSTDRRERQIEATAFVLNQAAEWV